MTAAVAAAAARLGGIKRIVLGHADADHRGAAPGLNAPVYCHPAEREAAESPEAYRAVLGRSKLDVRGRTVLWRLIAIWDGGPVQIAGTVEEGDEDRRLQGRRPPRSRPRPDRPVPRVRPARARVRHASTRSIPRAGIKSPLTSHTRRSTTTPSRPAHRSASSPRSSRRSSGPATPTRSPADVRRAARARRRRAGRWARASQAGEARGSHVGVPRRRGQRARAARLADARRATRVRRHPRRRARPRGRLAARHRAAVRAARGVVDDLGLEITRQKELLGRYRMAGAAERQFVRDTLREHAAEHFPELEAP